MYTEYQMKIIFFKRGAANSLTELSCCYHFGPVEKQIITIENFLRFVELEMCI